MANHILKEFYCGNLVPSERRIVKGSEFARAMDELSKAEEALERALPPDLLPVLKRAASMQTEVNGLTAEAYYVDGFKAGARFMMDILDDSYEDLEPVVRT